MTKVLLISLFHPELVRGGAQQLCYEVFEGLKARDDIDVTLLASIDGSQPGLYKSGARITGFDGRPGEFLYLSTEYDYGWHKTSNVLLLESYAEFLTLIQPDVVHFHHYMTLGVDLITLTRRTLPHCRIVLTLHDFISICMARGQMVRTMDGSLCTRASPVRCHQCFPEIPAEQFFVRDLWMKSHLDAVDVFTTPSRFMIDFYTEWGIDRSRIVHVTNAQRNYAPAGFGAAPRETRNRFGFFGQLVDNKGLHILLEAVDHLRSNGFTDFTVEINGENLRYASDERRKEIEDFLALEKSRPKDERNVVFNGGYQVDQIGQRMSRVDWCVVPSIWWEVFGLVITEAWMFGRPVIGSNVGGPAERIRHEVDGLQFDVGDPISLAETMRRASTEPGLWERLHKGIAPNIDRDVMVDGFIEVYRGTGGASAGGLVGKPSRKALAKVKG